MKQVRSYVLVCLLACIGMPVAAQVNITNTEYFFDTDPGFGNGTPVSITPAQNISALVFNANVAPLHNGMHTLSVRSKDANGKWSITNNLVIAKVQTPYANPYTAANIDKAEYFYDSDPGFGNGTDIPVTASTNISNMAFNASVSSLHSGMHSLYVRTRDASGKWSVTNSLLFAKVQGLYSNPYTAGNIVKAEYFYDTDPGFGSGTDIPLTAAANISGMVFNASVSSLHNGMHTMYVRTKDAQGRWSVSNTFNFAKVQSPYTNPYPTVNLVKMEYFFDTDPGIGNGTDVPITASANLSGFVVNIPISSLSNTIHTLYIRTKDAQGSWSITNMQQFSKIQGVSTSTYTATKIVKAEYFFDADPGFGSGTNIPLTPALDISGLAFNANVAPLHNGVHNLYVRTQDSVGQWSMSNVVTFAKVQSLYPNGYTANNINKAEYFYDTDPGLGNGTDIPVTAGTNISGLVANVNVASLHGGMHTLYLRTRDVNGQWSITNTMNFVKVQSPYTNPYTASNIVKAEYYYDTDPGFGAGTDIPLTAATDVSGLAFNANVASLHNGVHTLYVRTKDAQGKWSVTNTTTFAKVQSLYTNPHTTSNIAAIEFFVDTDPGLGNGSPVPFTSSTDVQNVAFNVDMTVLVNGPHTVYIRSKDAQGKWSLTNIHPFNGGTAPLSIKLVSFDAMLQNDNKVMLEWITDAEKDVAKYTIERSYNASSWTFVGEKSPVSSSSTSHKKYQLLDNEPGTGIVYYRLTETDLNGEKTQAPIRFVSISKGTETIASLYPNPNDGKRVTISSGIFAEGEVTVTILTSDGKIYLQQKLNDKTANTFTISDLQLAAGNYYVNLQSKNKTESLKLQVTGRL